ncbi:MAG: hypothetical protein HY260_10440 [Chloroflexi bacterium]|nr:hypothetical protein [Chloroflexota bacterium]
MTASDAIRQLIVALEGETAHFRELKEQVADTTARLPAGQPETHDIRSVAMLLTEIYLGAENLMRQIAKRLEEDIPSGEAWHQQLLMQFSTEVSGLRPTLFSPQTASTLDEFRRFRHVTHHAYASRFDWEQMSRLLSQAQSLLDMLIADAEAFWDFLSEAGKDE